MCAGQHARQHVAAKLVGAERMHPARVASDESAPRMRSDRYGVYQMPITARITMTASTVTPSSRTPRQPPRGDTVEREGDHAAAPPTRMRGLSTA